MQIHGREVHFKRTVSSNIKVIEELANGDSKNVGKIFDGGYAKSQQSAARFIAILSEGYEDMMKYSEPGYEPRPVTKDEALTLTEDEFETLFDEAIEAWSGEKPTVETAQVKKTKKQDEPSS